LRNKLSQLILTTLDRSFKMVSNSFFEPGLRGKRSQTCPYMLSAKQGSIWYYFYKVFGMTRSGIEPTTSLSRGERSNHWATGALTFANTNAYWTHCWFYHGGKLINWNFWVHQFKLDSALRKWHIGDAMRDNLTRLCLVSIIAEIVYRFWWVSNHWPLDRRIDNPFVGPSKMTIGRDKWRANT